MKLLKPNWLSHEGQPIFSLSLHPDGSRLATGGQGKDSGIVVIWNMAPVISAKAEKDLSVPKMLCELTNHLGCVNCVRWSIDGKLLASGGDDAIIMLWQLRYKGTTAPAFGSDKPIHEQWGCGHMLRGHNGDVLDMCWSHDQRYLASASVDNTIIIWNARKFPEKLSTLSGHTGLVKGITWDPVGKYLASQCDDKTLRVWRTSDWKEEASITSPFQKCGGTTHVLRLSWSPDGRFIVSAHSLNNDGPTAHIIDRNNWKTGMDFVGHRKAIEVVCFNPHLFTKGEEVNHGCIAVGSRDRSLSIWLTSLKRPLVVVHELFKDSILDLAWSKDGYTLMACSLDSSCAYVSLSDKELGTSLDKHAIDNLFIELYGTKRFSNGKQEDEPLDLLVEDPAMLDMHQKLLEPIDTQTESDNKTETYSTPLKVQFPTDDVPTIEKQVEMRTKDGRRRITPVMLTSQPSLSPIHGSPFMSSKLLTTPTKSINSPSKTIPNKELSMLSAVMTHEAMDCENKGSSTDKEVIGNVKSPPARPISFAPLSPDRKEVVSKNLDKGETKSQSRSDLKSRSLSAAKAILSGQKRVIDEDSSSYPPKSKRPKRSKAIEDSVPTSKHATPQKSTVSRHLSQHHPRPLIPVPQLESSLTTQLPSLLLDSPVENIEVTNLPSGCCVTCRRGEELCWSVSLSSPVLLLSANHTITCVACEDCTAAFLSTRTGRLLFPRILLSSQPCHLVTSSHFVVIATADASLSVYNTSTMTATLSNVKFGHMITDPTHLRDISLTSNGLPVISTHDCVYCFSNKMKTWFELSRSSEASIIHNSQFSLSSTLTELTPLRSLQNSTGLTGLTSFTNNSDHSQNVTLVYLESQITRSQCLGSILECEHWIKCYVRYLVSEKLEEKLREFCMGLTKVPMKSNFGVVDVTNCDTILTFLGSRTRPLLQDCMTIIASNPKLQRLYCELRDTVVDDTH